MILTFSIWTIVSLIFVCIGISCRKSKEPVGFFTFAKAPVVKEVTAYNRAVSNLWLIFALILEIIGIPFLFLEQNSPYFLLISIILIFLVIGIIAAYTKIQSKYS